MNPGGDRRITENADLGDGDMRFTTDFRHVYAKTATSWTACQDAASLLKGEFEPLPVFQA